MNNCKIKIEHDENSGLYHVFLFIDVSWSIIASHSEQRHAEKFVTTLNRWAYQQR